MWRSEAASGRMIDGRFRLIRLLGQGRGGQAWESVDEHTGTPVAIKFFERHVVAGQDARLSHPNIVTIYFTGTDGDVAYTVMELIDGVSLATVLEQGLLSRDDALSIASDICQALNVAHAAGIIHGNLKSTNVFVTHRGVAKVSDFADRGDPAMDMYSLGMLMEAMAGHRNQVIERLQSRRPYAAAELHDLLSRHRRAGDIDLRDSGDERQRHKPLRSAILSGLAALAVVIALYVWFLPPTSWTQLQRQSPSTAVSSSPVGSSSPRPNVPAVTGSTAAAAAQIPTTTAIGVDGVKAVIADLLKTGQIQSSAAAALNAKLDQIARLQSRGQTEMANDRLAALKALLAEQRRDKKVTMDGYHAIAASIDRLA